MHGPPNHDANGFATIVVAEGKDVSDEEEDHCLCIRKLEEDGRSRRKSEDLRSAFDPSVWTVSRDRAVDAIF
jgi:hypothetical protein